jgi:hypothetical protein
MENAEVEREECADECNEAGVEPKHWRHKSGKIDKTQGDHFQTKA